MPSLDLHGGGGAHDKHFMVPSTFPNDSQLASAQKCQLDFSRNEG